MTRKIMIAYDGSQLSHEALREAEIQVAGSPDTEVHVVTVVTQAGPVTNAGIARNIEEEIAAELRTQLQEVERKFDAGGQSIHTEVLIDSNQKNAAHKLTEYADEQGMDLIIIGSRGVGGVQKVFMGSVSTQVVQRAECNVMIIK